VKRIYCNGQTACQSGVPHTDDGDMTFLYYPNLEWGTMWGGALLFMEDDEIIKTVSYKPNRAVVFPSNIWHCADAPNKLVTDLRISLAYKLLNVETI
jgi:Rps23 Pro-64 3,4-dihydroxylase Tpa1-like proline 4-hydroxylase